jgi:3-hydroxyisobutyrate dehydrogenase-like beta-hydroxyacid dehydrogenase
MTEPLGFIGCGHMGGGMVTRLLDTGHTLVLCDIDAERLEPFVARGAAIAKTPKEVADACEIVFACLPGKEISKNVALGDAGVHRGGKIKIYVESSTLGLPTVRAIADGLKPRGIDVVDMPVSGGPRWAVAGELTTILAGSPKARAALDPILKKLAKNVMVVGDEPGLAQAAKIVNNAISLTGMIIAAEAVTMGVKAGLDADKLIEIINVSTGRNSATVDKFPKSVLPRTFNYGGPLDIGVKDLDLYLDQGRALGVPTFLGANVAALFQYVASQGGGQEDLTALVKHFEKWAGVEVRGKAAK